MIRRVLSAALVAAFVCVGVLVPATPATAVGVPPSALPDCTGTPPETGGWAVRDVLATGTRFEHPAPVRPRNIRLGEPCFDGEGLSDPVLAIPFRLTDIPVEMVDLDEDGMDDGGPEGSPATCTTYPTAAATPTEAELLSMATLCTGITAAWLSATGSNPPGFPQFATGDSYEVTVTSEDSDDVLVEYETITPLSSGQTQGGALRLWCRSNVGVLTVDENISVTWSTTVPTSSHLDCSHTTDVAEYVTWSRWTPDGVSAGQAMTMLAYFGAGSFPTDGTTSYTGFYGGSQAAQFQFGAWPSPEPGVPFEGVDSQSVILCSGTYTADVTTSHDFENGVTSYGEPPVIVDGEATEWQIWQNHYPGSPTDPGSVYLSNCPYLVEIQMWVCTYVDHPIAGVPQYGCQLLVWDADRWRDRNPYQGGDAGTDEEAICDLLPDTPGCFDVLNPTPIDGTDFDVACAGAPEPTWAVWDWLFPWVGHMARCLFVPLNGWDRLGWVESAWQGGAGGDLSDTMSALGDALVIDGGCGALLDGNVMGADVELDTCSWEWAAGGRTLLFWFITIMGGIAAIIFLARTIFGLIDGRTPTPFAEDK